MLAWITGNLGTILITLLLLLIVTGIIRSMIKDKKQGKLTCGGNCAQCRMCCSCSNNSKHSAAESVPKVPRERHFFRENVRNN